MSANNIYLLFLGALVVATFALYGASIKWGLKWAGIRDISMAKATGLYFVFLISAVLAIGLLVAPLLLLSAEPPHRVLDIVGYVGHFFVASFVVALIYKVRLRQAAKSIVPYMLVAVLVPVLLVFGIRPFMYEAFWIPTNSMAPTLLGTHWTATCPRCGHPAYGRPVESESVVPPEGVLMICSNERTSVLIANPPTDVIDGDRILICKLISPRRWDMIGFRHPEDPSVYYVMRLVGLPNEKLEIRDGAVWINGEKQNPPASIAGIRYSPTIEHDGTVYSGPGSGPVKLGPDEYFVLGDFTEQSSDSRLWQQGAPGYPPYAVPESHIVGVVINIYWPINRWQAFR